MIDGGECCSQHSVFVRHFKTTVEFARSAQTDRIRGVPHNNCSVSFLHFHRFCVRTVIACKRATYASSEINELKIKILSKSLIVHFGATESISIGIGRAAGP